jgi:hypothetical protein
MLGLSYGRHQNEQNCPHNHQKTLFGDHLNWVQVQNLQGVHEHLLAQRVQEAMMMTTFWLLHSKRTHSSSVARFQLRKFHLNVQYYVYHASHIVFYFIHWS